MTKEDIHRAERKALRFASVLHKDARLGRLRPLYTSEEIRKIIFKELGLNHRTKFLREVWIAETSAHNPDLDIEHLAEAVKDFCSYLRFHLKLKEYL